ncbi:MAG: capsular biosynthesis protein [Mongoliibacter sp.]|uniref:Stealth CR1 domain-containing protein n=1 Tax=Mongoliibacter sp. TaxID=2022438 RepID=UPI0012EF98EB|nr:Stealth CR1 domain-containing protein [Mongoliibacter sp.]TVP49006.1 MAG: capsular biosynthesis protein [Mongoliibacter sp.]
MTYSTRKQPIDAVITWVDGNDPIHQSKMDNALKGKTRKYIPGAEKTRFGNANELKYSTLSLLKFAPFIRKIFIVTDSQYPNIQDDIEKTFPDRVNDVQVIDHKEIFRDHLEFLPTFNSRSIEALLWKIKDLSENFIYLSDDMFVIRPLKPQDLFLEGRPVMRGKWLVRPVLRNLWNALNTKMQHKLLKNKAFQPKPSFHIGQWNSAKALGFKWSYFFSSHTPHAVNKNTLKNYFDKHPDILTNQVKYKFRHNSQFNCASFFYHLEIKSGNTNFARPSFISLHPFNRWDGYIEKKLNRCESNSKLLFINIQSLELCSEENQKKLKEWLWKNLGL